ncbi:hypothetical protein PsorP6_012772 [Peronosclerospora sorghi]|uniref:Uncharacterized protein n=1 Tax=Peronosclerospora sorghi TaxID=230839 RepID=A0ACC0WGF7_9STRA|nr:hypothetical protein PsorP6_012772 [Peronosclerospora sorghi]
MDSKSIAPDTSVSKAQLYETFDLLPNLIEVLKDVLSASSTQETIRIGDIAASAVSVKKKYTEAFELLRSLPGTDTSLDEQEFAIAHAKVELKRISYVDSESFQFACLIT